MEDLRSLPLFVYLLFVTGLGMLAPCVYALRFQALEVSGVFLINAIAVLTVTTMIGLAMNERKPKSTARLHLVTLLGAYIVLPAIAALPLIGLVEGLTFWPGYFEMLSALTTTGATLFPDGTTLIAPVHLWRGMFGWFGGFMILVAAYAILEPLNLGGFEVRTAFAGAQPGQPSDKRQNDDPSDRIIRIVKVILPIYVALTFLLALGLILAGDRPFVAVVHAMAVLSTSGISPIGGLEYASSGVLGELCIAIFLAFALTHTIISLHQHREATRNPLKDPEVQLGLSLICIVSVVLFLRHFLDLDVTEGNNIREAVAAFWGTIFTSLSFLTTAGFASSQWETAHGWSDLTMSGGLVLMALAMFGGGIATTAGGIKLLRMFALYRHGIREMERLVHPSSIGASGRAGRRIRREGAYIAWMFLMLFFLTLAGVFLALTLLGLDFESAFVISTATLTNTGPLPNFFNHIDSYDSLGTNALAILNIAMILGRVEVLVVIALLNPEYWRR